MGLFGGGKKLCPICGNPVSWFLPIKWNGQPLCDACGGKLTELSGDIRGKVEESETSIREYFAAFDENQALRGSFQQTYRHDFGIFFGGCVCLDIPQRLLRLSSSDNAFVYGAENIVSFRITEDDAPLFEGTKDELVCYQSAVPGRVMGMEYEVDRMRMEIRQCEQMKRMEEHMEQQAKARGENYTAQYISTPDPSCLNPFKKYHVYIELDHPYKKEKKEFKEDGPGFNSYDPTVRGYMSAYENSSKEMRTLAASLMAVINPDAPERQVGGPVDAQDAPGARTMPVTPAAPADPVAEIQKYKGLLDSGAITEEEFTAKKRQLMGI